MDITPFSKIGNSISFKLLIRNVFRTFDLITNTSIKGIVFLKAKYLLYLLGMKIKYPLIEVQDFRNIFTHNGVIKEEELDQIVPDFPEI